MGRRYDLITFDFDGVLLHNDFNDRLVALARERGIPVTPERATELARFVHRYYGTGRSTRDIERYGWEGFWPVAVGYFLEVLAGRPRATLIDLASELMPHLAPPNVRFFHETGLHDMLDALRLEGYRLAMLTNRGDQVHETGGEWDLIAPFEFIGTRDTVGAQKPAPDLFHHISARFDVPATRALHIGDNPFADVEGAHAAAWDVVLIDPDDLFPDWDVPRLKSIHELPPWLQSVP